MVDVRFVARLQHPVTLAWVKKLAGLAAPPDGVAYIGPGGLQAIKDMPLVNRGRLSVQPVSDEAYAAIVAMGERGGMDELPPPKKAKAKESVKAEKDEGDGEKGTASGKRAKAGEGVKKEPKRQAEEPPNGKVKREDTDAPMQKKPKTEPKPAAVGTRRSARLRT